MPPPPPPPLLKAVPPPPFHAELAETLEQLDSYCRTVLPRMPSSRAFFRDQNDMASFQQIDFAASAQAVPVRIDPLFRLLAYFGCSIIHAQTMDFGTDRTSFTR